MTDHDENFLAKVFDSVTDPFAIYDRQFRILKTNQALLILFKLPAEKVIGRYCYNFFYNRTSMCEDCHVKEVFKYGESRMIEKHITFPDGNERIFEVHSYPIKDNKGNTLQAIEHARDITERKLLENELKVSQKFNDQLLNSITDSLIVVDPKTHRILQANLSFHSRIGVKPPKALGRTCHKIMLNSHTPCEDSGTPCPIRETFRTKQPTLTDRVYPNSAGEERLLEVATYPIFNSSGAITSIIRLERDVTEKRQMEKALTFRSKELEKTHTQLETLFHISRLVSAKNSLSDVVNYVQEIVQEIFADSELSLFLLDLEMRRFLNLEDCDAVLFEPVSRAMQTLEKSGFLSDFVQYTKDIRDDKIVSSDYSNDMPDFLRLIVKSYPSWFAFPVSTSERCIGYFIMGSLVFQPFVKEDIRFFHNLIRQIAGDIHHLIRHETLINQFRQDAGEKTSYGEIIGQSDEMQKIYELIDLVSGSDATVLITGENGTGKELVAMAIHRNSHREKGPFVVANCSAYSPALLESELFGHEKGAFTGAIKRKKGRIERAKRGTLFLDEIGDIAPATQVLLLRFLQDHCFERVGGEKTLEAEVRVLAATNRDLAKEVEAGRFRDDLYYRLNVVTIHLPSLRDRTEDIPLLCKHFLKYYNLKENKEIDSISPEAMQVLMDYEWPGNVRQLENAISHAVILAQGQILERAHLPQFLKRSIPDLSPISLAENERRLILDVLQESNWNKHKAARRLKISRSTLYSKIRRYNLQNPTDSV
jgi:PAS domain S-box-containing protein